MKRFAVMACLAACGGAGGIVDQSPAINILSVQCTTVGPDTVDVNVEIDVTMAVGQGIDADVAIAAAPPATQVDDFYSCQDWTITNVGTKDAGCQRDTSTQDLSNQVSLTHNETVGGTLPIPTSVSISAFVRPSPLSTAIVVQDAMTAPCN